MIVYKFKSKEPNPYLNEVWDMGYDEAYVCEMTNTLTLINSKNKTKKNSYSMSIDGLFKH